jgi:hypothetical protein
MINTVNDNNNNENNFKNSSEIEFDTQLYCTPRGSISEQSVDFKQAAFVRQSKFSATMKEKYFQLKNNNDDNLKLKNDFIFDIEK